MEFVMADRLAALGRDRTEFTGSHYKPSVKVFDFITIELNILAIRGNVSPVSVYHSIGC
jgi:hypothetical protein